VFPVYPVIGHNNLYGIGAMPDPPASCGGGLYCTTAGEFDSFGVMFLGRTMLVIASVLTLLAAAGALYQFIGARRDVRRYAAPGMMVDVGGHQLHVVCAGNGNPPVLFESGIAASSLSWARVLRDVAAFTRACAYDRAGLGWSDPSRGPRSVARMIGELQAVLSNATSSGPYVLVGHSFGAFLVCAYASQRPNDIAGLVLLDPPSEWHEITREQARLLSGGIQLSRLGGVLARLGIVRACLSLLAGGAPGVPRKFVQVFGLTAARTLERLVGEVRKLPSDVHPIVQALWCRPKCFRAMADHLAVLEETAALVSRVKSLPDVPMVIVSSGDQSPDTIAKHRQLARLSERSRHVIATKSGHWIQFDEPDLVVAAIREIVDQARRTNAA
jgi:pimeloyl-ACP methyl ester carboxylesterase